MNGVEQVIILDMIDLESDDENPVKKCGLCKTTCGGHRVKDRLVKYNMERFDDFKKKLRWWGV